MIVLDLCAGTGSSTQAFKDRGHEVESLDIEGNHTYICDVREFTTSKHYDFIWASPPCTCFSCAGAWAHWKDKKPNKETIDAINIVKSVINIIETSKKQNNNFQFFAIENPVGKLQTLNFMKDLERQNFRTVVTYCQYGLDIMKRTNIWHNIPNFVGKRCKNGDKCHINQPHGTHTGGTQDMKATDSGKVPYKLSLEICKCIERLI